MRRRIENQEFEVDDMGTGVYEDLELVNCTARLNLSRGANPERSTVIRNLTARNLTLAPPHLRHSIVQDVFVEGLKVQGFRGTSILNATMFRHVKLSGKVRGSSILLNPINYPELEPVFRERFFEFYKDVDWALDISEADFNDEVSLRWIPGELVIRNPETQILVSRERAEFFSTKDQEDYTVGESTLAYAPYSVISNDLDYTVVVAQTSGKYAADDLATLEVLRKAGVAVPEDEAEEIQRRRLQA